MKPATLRPFLPRPAIRRRARPHVYRPYAISAPGPATLQVFNDHTKHLQRERSAADPEGSRKVDYLRTEVAARLTERLLVRRFSHSTFHDRLKLILATRISNATSLMS